MRDAIRRDAGVLALLVLAVFGAFAGPASGAVTAAQGTSTDANGVASTGAGAAGAAGAGPAADALTQVDCSYPVTVTDATGQEVTVGEEPGRVVVLAPSAAQTMWAIGAQDKVVGMPVDFFTGYLDGKEGKADVVNDEGQPVQERVVDAEPDLVLAPNVITNDTVNNLREAGLTVYRFRAAGSLADVSEKTELTGRLVGEFEAAARVSAETRGKVAAIRDAVSGADRPTVYFDLGFGYTAGPSTFIGHLIETAGGENIATADDLSGPYGQMSPERILEEDPEWILNTTGTSLSRNVGINQSTALREGQVVTVEANFLNQPGPRNLEPLAELARALHPEAMSDVVLDSVETPQPAQCDAPTTPDGTDVADAESPTPTPTDAMADGDGTPTDATGDATPTEAMADDTPTPTTASGDGGPGFTAVTALVAALVAALAVRRRR